LPRGARVTADAKPRAIDPRAGRGRARRRRRAFRAARGREAAPARGRVPPFLRRGADPARPRSLPVGPQRAGGARAGAGALATGIRGRKRRGRRRSPALLRGDVPRSGLRGAGALRRREGLVRPRRGSLSPGALAPTRPEPARAPQPGSDESPRRDEGRATAGGGTGERGRPLVALPRDPGAGLRRLVREALPVGDGRAVRRLVLVAGVGLGAAAAAAPQTPPTFSTAIQAVRVDVLVSEDERPLL